MSNVQRVFPIAPEAVWNALPAGVTAIKGKGPIYDAPRGTLAFRTGMSVITWGHEFAAQVYAGPEGTTLSITSSLKMGFFDYGEGKRRATKFVNAVGAALGIPAPN